jgi:hypothetical protein
MVADWPFELGLLHDLPHLLPWEEAGPTLVKVCEDLLVPLQVLMPDVPWGLGGLDHHLLEHGLLLAHHLLLGGLHLFNLLGLVDCWDQGMQLVKGVYVELIEIRYVPRDLFCSRLLRSLGSYRVLEARITRG